MTNDKFCDLLDSVIHKDISALKAIYEEYFSKIQYTAFTIVNNENDAYDVAMNVFVKLINYPSDPYAIHVMTKVNQFAIENGIRFDSQAVSNKIEELIGLSKNVNSDRQEEEA